MGGAMAAVGITFDNSYARDLPGSYLPARPEGAPAPRVLIYNHALAAELGLDPALALHAAEVFSGNHPPEGAALIAQAYAGHQFGQFNPALGDGRALLLGEVLAPDGRRHDLQFKGSGRTPFSRGGDGKAAVGPMLREYLMSAAFAGLGIPSTRALAVVATGARVMRETPLPGAVLTRVAASHLRIGTVQFFAARGDLDGLRRLVDYALWRHDPEAALADNRALALLRGVMARQVRLVARWMGIGFVHGVMNTDNITLSGETIDFGPCAFVDAYAPGAVFSSIDRQGRYAFGNQPMILGWNLARLAEALLPLIDPDPDRAVDLANAELDRYADAYAAAWGAVMAEKLGLAAPDAALGDDLLALMAETGADFTQTFRRLTDAAGQGDSAPLRPALPGDAARWAPWLARWAGARAPDAAARMARANPVVIARNHRVEQALAAAVTGDMAPFHDLVAALATPFDTRAAERFTLPPPAGFGPHVTYCGT